MARKHITQFAKGEEGWVAGFVRRHTFYAAGAPHFYDRAAERHFTMDDAREALQTGRIVELHNDRGEWRTLVRNANGTCVVVALDSLQVITVYYNDPEDQHDTLNHNLYHGGPAIDVVAVIKSLLKNRR